jgi:FlaA1/EpsC-like NDP-sugar epimerase
MLGQHSGKLVLVATDAIALSLSGFIGVWLRFEGAPPVAHLLTWARFLLLAVPLYLVTYYYFGLYRRLWRYATVEDLLVIAIAVSVATFAFSSLILAIPNLSFPRSVLAMTWLTNIAAVGGARFLIRLARSARLKRPSRGGGKPTLIIGAGEAGRIVVDESAKHPELDYHLIGFLDDDPKKTGLEIAGLPVLGSLIMLEEVISSQGITQVVIAMPSASYITTRSLVSRCAELKINAQIVPGLYSILGDHCNVSAIRDVQIEDLLPRPEIKLDCAGIAGYLAAKTVLITGAGGSIGAELSRQIAGFEPKQLVLLGRGENSIYDIHKELLRDFPYLKITPVIADIQDAPRINHIFAVHKPHVVFHAAAHKHVPLMEQNPTEALKNNVFGTQNVAEAAHTHKAERFVLVSTDKAVNPTSVMGASKRLAELVVQSINQQSLTRFMSVRFGNVLGSRGSVIPLFKEQIARGGPVTVTHPEMTRYFMTIPEAVSLIIQAGGMGQGGEVYVLDMGAPVRIVDLARDLITLSGLAPHTDIPLEFVGLREGEKLYEELFAATEEVCATEHERIFASKQIPLSPRSLGSCLNSVQTFIRQGCDPQDVLELLATINQDATRHVAASSELEYAVGDVAID